MSDRSELDQRSERHLRSLSVSITLLDGPMGTELLARGVETPLPGWSAYALDTAPEIVRDIHADYAAAGATVHRTNTFRTKRRDAPERWQERTRRAVELCREAVPSSHRVAGSIAPLEDCYTPAESPEDPRAEHREFARALADYGCDLLVCETFPHVAEGLIAVEEAVATGCETWIAFTAGPKANLLTPSEIASAGREAVQRGASAVLVNCVPVLRTSEYVAELADLGVRFGAYANAGEPDDGFGWRSDPGEPDRYACVALEWADLGATILGACCGTGPAHVRALARALSPSS